ncbi:uncharacterized protein BX664DRAFT_322921 [Halteromyces radiatus]|uniref:uncharacterized protein n=1 Tax=Halteromyces radiatus TaxID=101107 RepID=UPI00222026B3|nr:uncharacterized protein BX664DRAFT_322921 [Halteromyces radiatus]KAI8100118.1 hypothetical protein BX664DRAFT_322921 [Halteromyces radiatus]
MAISGDSTSTRKTGQVKFFNSTKGYGFILPNDSSANLKDPNTMEEVFVHHTAIQNNGGFKSLREGEEVNLSNKKLEEKMNIQEKERDN